MFSIYKVGTFAAVAVISASVLMSTSSIAAPAQPTEAEAAPMVVAFAQTVTKSEARRMVRDQLRADGNRKLRVGTTSRSNGAWLVTVTSVEGIPVYTVRVDSVSGELSRS